MGEIYQSSLVKGFGSIILNLLSFSSLGYVVSLLFNNFRLYNFLLENKLLVLIILGVFISLYLGKTNNDFLLKDDSLIVKSRVPLLKREKQFPLSKIRKVVISSEWSENIFKKQLIGTPRFIIVNFMLALFFPHDYKWVKVIDSNGNSFLYYCFGLEFDYYDNYEDIRIEHLFEDLKAKGISVSWSNPNDNYLL